MIAAHASTTLQRAARVRKAGSSLRQEEAIAEVHPMGPEGVNPIRYSCGGAPARNNQPRLRIRRKALCPA